MCEYFFTTGWGLSFQLSNYPISDYSVSPYFAHRLSYSNKNMTLPNPQDNFHHSQTHSLCQQRKHVMLPRPPTYYLWECNGQSLMVHLFDFAEYLPNGTVYNMLMSRKMFSCFPNTTWSSFIPKVGGKSGYCFLIFLKWTHILLSLVLRWRSSFYTPMVFFTSLSHYASTRDTNTNDMWLDIGIALPSSLNITTCDGT